MTIKYVKYPMPNMPYCDGVFYPGSNKIFIRQGLPLKKHLYTLCHELGHYLIHQLWLPYLWKSYLDYFWEILDITLFWDIRDIRRGYKLANEYYTKLIFKKK